MKPSVGRIVHYTLTETDAQAINRRRTTGAVIAERIRAGAWPLGAQAHIGNMAEAGQVYPMVIVRVWPDDGMSPVNGRVMLDGNDDLWATSVHQVITGSTDAQGLWQWPARD